MARWEPNARERLEKAAMELFTERGFDVTTVSDIADRAGLTERTFFRYYADKREVLFYGSPALQDTLVGHVTNAAKDIAPLDAVVAALEAVAPWMEERRAWSVKRYDLISKHDELRERELVKLATLATAIAEALERRGVTALAAKLAAETGIAIFKIGYENWLSDPKRNPAQHFREALAGVRSL